MLKTTNPAECPLQALLNLVSLRLQVVSQVVSQVSRRLL
jgi:hypothetical protein